MNRKLVYVLLSVTLLSLLAVSACNTAGNSPTNTNTAETHHTAPPPTSSIPAHMNTAPAKGSLPPTLDPAMFEDFDVRSTYAVAREAPELLAQLPCYCYCDRGMGHKSLHSCFEDRHASVCKICLDEAQMAVRLQKQGRSTDDIRKQIIDAFGRTN